jgi:hypothetical protein
MPLRSDERIRREPVNYRQASLFKRYSLRGALCPIECRDPALMNRSETTAAALNSAAEAGPPPAAVCATCRIQVPLDELLVPEMMDCLTWLCGLDCYAQALGDAVVLYPMLRPLTPSRHRRHCGNRAERFDLPEVDRETAYQKRIVAPKLVI